MLVALALHKSGEACITFQESRELKVRTWRGLYHASGKSGTQSTNVERPASRFRKIGNSEYKRGETCITFQESRELGVQTWRDLHHVSGKSGTQSTNVERPVSRFRKVGNSKYERGEACITFQGSPRLGSDVAGRGCAGNMRVDRKTMPNTSFEPSPHVGLGNLTEEEP
jgi:hypothetical protein